MYIHPSITQDRIIAVVQEDDNRGFCVSCGEEAHNVEPDAREYRCSACNANSVYGAEELLIELAA